jgi:hypothetical protein
MKTAKKIENPSIQAIICSQKNNNIKIWSQLIFFCTVHYILLLLEENKNFSSEDSA